jgi:hypothetical protein
VQSRQAKTIAGNDGLARSTKDGSGLNACLEYISGYHLWQQLANCHRRCRVMIGHAQFNLLEQKSKYLSTIPETSPSGGSELTSSAKQSFGNIRASSSAPSSTAPAPNLERQAPQSNNTSVFETAQTHLTSETTHAASSRQESDSARPLISPKVTRLRHFTEVASPTLPDAIGEDVGDIPLITSQDVEYQAAINGSSPVRPSRKRRRGAGALVRPYQTQTL